MLAHMDCSPGLRVRALLAVTSLLALPACGARTGLLIPAYDAAVTDIPAPTDVLGDIPTIHPDVCGSTTVVCPPAIATTAGIIVPLNATVTFTSHATLATQTWSVTAAPSGSSGVLSSANTNPTTFSGNAAGTYTVQYAVTDTNGCTAVCTVPVTIAPTYRGTEFWAVSTTNSDLVGGGAFHFAVAVGNSNDVAVTATITGGALTAPMTLSVPPHSAQTQILPWVTSLSHNTSYFAGDLSLCCDAECCGMDSTCTVAGGEPSVSSLVPNGAYHIVTSAPVSIYQFNPLEFSTNSLCENATNSYTNDASLLLPTTAVTGNYLVLAHNAFSSAGSFVAITATHPGTTHVQVNLSTDITPGPGVNAAAAHTSQTYSLQQGDVVQLVSMSGTALTFLAYDLTGTEIQADNPVVVFAGVDCTFMSYPRGDQYACDHIEQELFPIETWGRDVVVSQLQDRAPDEKYMVRVLSGSANNQITFVPPVHISAVLSRGGYVEFESTRDFEVTATAPILVGQYMEGQDTTPGATVGDPAFVLEVPAPQYRQEYTFVVPSTYTASYLNIVVHTGSGFLLDGRPHGGHYAPVYGTTWSVWRLPISPGSHRVDSTDGHPFGLKVIGVAPYTSYMYPGGLDLQSLTP